MNYYLVCIYIFIIGLCVGSFLNVVIHRLPIMLQREWEKECVECLKLDKKQNDEQNFNLIIPRSFCPSCGKKIKWYQNVPLLSFFLLRGKCPNCQTKISLQYPFIELLTALLTLWCFTYWNLSAQFVLSSLLIWGLVSLAFIDLRTQFLPDVITIPLLWLGLWANTFDYFCTPKEAILGALIGYMSLWSVMKLFYLLTKKVGMGHGDFKLFALIGAWVGWQGLALTLFISSFLGALVGSIYLKVKDQSHQVPIPFGPYLCFAGFITFFWGKDVLNWYLSYSGL